MSVEPASCRYSQTHEWFCNEAGVVTMGITPFAANQLTDITYVELPPIGTHVEPGTPFGEIESVKATSDLYSDIAGTIVEINASLTNDPGLVNNDPFGEGWMVKIKPDTPDTLNQLMDAPAYQQMLGGLDKE